MNPSATFSPSVKIAEMRAQNINVIDLSVGNPSLSPPVHITNAFIQAVCEGHTGYSFPEAGLLSLRQKIAETYNRQGHKVDADRNVFVTPGCKAGLSSTIRALTETGDTVVCSAPYWPSYPEMVENAHAVFKSIQISQKQNFQITPEQLDRVIDKNTKIVIFTSPHNPTGAVLKPEQIIAYKKVLNLHKNQHVTILADEIYKDIIFDGVQHTSFLGREVEDRIVISGSISKSCVINGLRIGYLIGTEKTLRKIYPILSNNYGGVCNPSQYAYKAALDNIGETTDFISCFKNACQQSRDISMTQLNEIFDTECLKPEGTFYIFPSCQNVMGKVTPEGKMIQNDLDYVAYLLDKAHVAVVAGSKFGKPDHFRMQFAVPKETLKEGLNRIKEATHCLRVI